MLSLHELAYCLLALYTIHEPVTIPQDGSLLVLFATACHGDPERAFSIDCATNCIEYRANV